MLYYTATDPDVSETAIDRAQGYPTTSLEIALGRMGEGVVFNRYGAIVAFHPRHADTLTARGTARMTHA